MDKIKFSQNQHDSLFLKVLNQRVNSYFEASEKSKYANNTAIHKGLILLFAYIISYAFLIFSQSLFTFYLAYICLGIITIFVALNVAHDAAHDVFVNSKKGNQMLLYVFDFLGASGYMWKLKHVHSHHPHVNIPDMDGDIKQSNLVRIFPNAPYLNFHKYQYLYMPILYAFYTFIWLVFRDFKDFFKTDISGKKKIKHPVVEYLKLFIGKVFFFGRMLFIPWLLLPFSFGQIFLGFMLFHIAASYTVAMALISAHVGETSVYPKPDQEGKMENSWVRHQMITTTDFATDSKIITHLFGGFNHHVAHHLFPRICHIHYPMLTRILKDTSEEYNMPYQANKTLLDATISHLKFLKMRSQQGILVPYIEM